MRPDDVEAHQDHRRHLTPEMAAGIERTVAALPPLPENVGQWLDCHVRPDHEGMPLAPAAPSRSAPLCVVCGHLWGAGPWPQRCPRIVP